MSSSSSSRSVALLKKGDVIVDLGDRYIDEFHEVWWDVDPLVQDLQLD